ncbi:MAG: S8 family serine peptidase [Bacilli bacterium]|nr:S8 family serine peptidase [Bacilli bacterium]
MKKLGLLLCASATLVLAACSAGASQLKSLPERDKRIIVEVDRDIDTLSEEGAKNSQRAVYNNIKTTATSNIRLLDNYTVLNNAFVLEVNSNDIESIRSVPGVKSITVDKIHWERVINNDSYIPLGDDSVDSQDENKNISAETMFKPENTNDGEGTIVAILDNEFHFRAKVTGKNASPEWHHEVYEPLSSEVKVKYTFETIRAIGGLNASFSDMTIKPAGQEGSGYLNSKVPFYYDYGGTSKSYGKRGPKKYDVHSDLSYHGSHVSSITAANAPDYKGIAPKAQLALMKVFTDYDASGIGKKIGLSNSTGAYDTAILEALEDCIKLRVDGINMSLGSDLDDFDSDSITLKTLTRLHNAGILSAISAGNSGKTSYASTGAYANWMPESVETGIMSSYANNAASTTVASGHPTKIFYENAFVFNNQNIAFEDQITNRPGMGDDYDKEFRISDIFPKDGEGKPTGTIDWVYIPGFGTSGDYKGFTDEFLEGKIFIVNRGSTSFSDKYSIAADKGAKALVIINNDPTASSFNFRCSFGDGFNPTMPCALVLYKDKPTFETAGSGTFSLINKQVSDNPAKYTISEFSTDGATFDLDLKPDITAPGDNIRGAVPEHAMTNLTQEERESAEYKYKCYQYLSGTSMSAPNYAGAQALVLSKFADEVNTRNEATQNILSNMPGTTQEEVDARNAALDEVDTEFNKVRGTVDMRLMSTANPMKDYVANPENEEETFSLTSPRIQGAGMVDLAGALSTDVYLEGLDLSGNEPKKLDKSKIVLRNNDDIAKGDIKLSFIAHNESDQARTYDVTLTVLRPAIAHPNDIVTKEYNYKGSVESIELFTGMTYYDRYREEMRTVTGPLAYKDAIKAGKDIEYYASEADFKADKKTVIAKGYYYNSATEGACWEPLPSYTAQSTMDVEIAKISNQTVTVAANGETTVTINPFTLPETEKAKILEVYEYGCMIEGFVTLTSKDGKPDLSIPYLGFYSGTDKNSEAGYESAPVVEPFNFEKDPTKVYPSDLNNDIAKELVGKNMCNMESMIVAGHLDSPQKLDTDKILTNDMSFDKLIDFYNVGTNPYTNEYVEDAKNNIYIGGDSTNTMIIQQFVLRSVAENYFTITNKKNNQLVYKSALEDMLFSDTADHWALYKSHVDAGYLGAGYVCHRAYAIVPLFDEATGEKFASGDYELKFNYQLAATKGWVEKSYDIHIDTDAPDVKSISQYKENDVNRVRIYLEDMKVSYALLGTTRVEVEYDNAKNLYYIDETKAFVDECIDEISEDTDGKRLFVGVIDYARGRTGSVIHFKNIKNFTYGYEVVQGTGLSLNIDYRLGSDNKVEFFNCYSGKSVDVKGDLKLTRYAALPGTANSPSVQNPEATINLIQGTVAEGRRSSCNGAIASLSAIICIPALMGATVLFFRKRKEGGK